MPPLKIFRHALEGNPDAPNFQAATERDIRIKWLITGLGGTGPGPWRLSRTIPAGIVLERSGAQPTPLYINEVHLIFVSDGNALSSMLINDQLDFAPSVTDPNTFASLLGAPRIHTVAAGGHNVFYLGFCMNRPPFDDVNARKGIACAIDVYKYLPLGKGAAAPAIGPVPPGMRGHNPKIRQLGFDLGMARTFLTTYTSTRGSIAPLTLLCGHPNTYAGRLAQSIASDLSNSGLGLTVSPQYCGSWNAMLAQLGTAPGQMFIYSWNQRQAYADDPDKWMHALFHSGGSGNKTHYAGVDPEVDYSRTTKNHPQAHRRISQDDVPMVCLSHWNRISAYRDNVTNLHLTYGGLPDDQLIAVDV